jgi:hypothetical protein
VPAAVTVAAAAVAAAAAAAAVVAAVAVNQGKDAVVEVNQDGYVNQEKQRVENI